MYRVFLFFLKKLWIAGRDVLIIDHNNRDHSIEKVPGKVIFELVSQHVLREANYSYIISIDDGGKKFDSRLHREPGKIINLP